jgi:uncharacterized protein
VHKHYYAVMKLTAIHLFPIKSVAARSVSKAEVQARGLKYDRRWMIVDSSGKFITGRQLPAMVLIQALADDVGLILHAPMMPELRVNTPAGNAQRLPVNVWGDRVNAALANHEAHAWLSRFLNTEVRLVFMDDASERRVELEPPHVPAAHDVSFADGYPLLLISEASLLHLNQKLKVPISMLRFRPNLVVSADQPHTEDSWKQIRIGAVEFDLIKTCTRCVFTTVDPISGEKDPAGEPLATLKTYRRSADGIIFGMNLIARNHGIIHIGDALTVLA